MFPMSTFAAREVISTTISFPSSSLRGFVATCTADRRPVVPKYLLLEMFECIISLKELAWD